jgi:hypothetical protein
MPTSPKKSLRRTANVNVANPKDKNEDGANDSGRHFAGDEADHESGAPQYDDNNVVEMHAHRKKTSHESRSRNSHMDAVMSDTPSRPEIAAELRAAEAKTEMRIAQWGAAAEARAAASDHKIDLVSGKIDALVVAVSEMKLDSKKTREVIWTVGIGAVIAILGLVVALWIAGINVQGNMISVFQAGLGVRAVNQDAPTSPKIAAPISPPAASPPSPAPPK